MNVGVIAKVAGWLQAFAFALANGTPHGLEEWLALFVSVAGAVGIHAASKSGPAVKP